MTPEPPELSNVLQSLGYRTEPHVNGQVRVFDSIGKIAFVGCEFETWAWLKRTEQFHHEMFEVKP